MSTTFSPEEGFVVYQRSNHIIWGGIHGYLSPAPEELGDWEKELTYIQNNLLSLDLKETNELSTLQAILEGEIFESSLQVKKLLLVSSCKTDLPTSSVNGKGVKLPKPDVPTFDGI